MPVQYRYEGAALEGEKRMELTVVPKLALRVTPDIAIDPAGRGTNPSAVEREIRVKVTNDDKGATAGQVRLDVPAGWRVTPPTAPVNFTREDEELTVRFMVRPAATTALGQYNIKAVATVGTQSFDTGYQVVEYPHTRRRQLEMPAAVSFKVMDVRVAPNLTVGYVMGSGDEVPTALRQLGAKVEMLDADQLAWGDLSRYDAIVTGVRAYEKRPDLVANNQRILDYAAKGGTVHRAVQPARPEAGSTTRSTGPYPARVTITRVTDENGEVQILAGDNPAFHYPNEIGPRSGTDGCRSAARIFSRRRIRTTSICSRCSSRSTTTRDGRRARSSKRRSARGTGCTSASACGARWRPAPTARIS